MSALVSIIVPVYNVAPYIEKCAHSLFAQTYPNIQYIFVDDSSTDNSMGLLFGVLQCYPHRIEAVSTVKHAENRGLPTARNSGLNIAKGDYILHCDSDDWIAPDMIEKLMEIAVKTQAAIVFCDIYNVYGDHYIRFSQTKKATYSEYLKEFFEGKSQGSVCNKLIKSDLFSAYNIRFPDGLPMLEDLRTVVQLYYYADRIEYLSLPLYYYVKTRTDSISGSGYQKSKTVSEDRVLNVQFIQQFLSEKNIAGLDRELAVLKLEAKRNLLINADQIAVLQQWREIFPEANDCIGIAPLPWHYKFIASCVLRDYWLVPRCWIWLKKVKASIAGEK
ncbi:hypothetical protein BWD42_07310 [Sphingobacterium sp. CZ-UAM]|uniref:glycosyltransferase family 2 protein n=1 Tax=Sphingobacterium sp. CZ-UAM TaxID=1933868 RepID=UPI0009862E41|nr:glycosyltransferase family 2 protein [Sphingobacterium sp. CZ-UAM]OOG19704.1 hypothetical protein BWD42_07310 [Sphingobacterium sp. CZ-UAM]